MSRKKRILILSAIAIIIALLTFGGVRIYQNLKEPRLIAFEALPDGLAFALKVPQPFQLHSELLNQNTLWSTLTQFNEFHALDSLINALDSFISQDKKIKQLLTDNGLLISVHFTGNDKFMPFFAVELSQTGSRKPLRNFLKKSGAEQSSIYRTEKIYTIRLNDQQNLFYTITHGLFLASYSNPLLIQSIDRIKDRTSWPGYEKFILSAELAGLNTNNIFIHHRYFTRFILKYSNPQFVEQISGLADILSFTELDLMIKSGSYVMNGYTLLADTGKGLLSALRNQESAPIGASSVIPPNAAMALFVGMNDIEKLVNDLHHDSPVQALNADYSINIKEDIFSWIKSQFCYFVLSGPNEQMQNTFLCFKTTDPREAAQKLEWLAHKSDASLYNDTLTFRNYPIRRLGMPDLWERMLGPAFAGISKNYYTFIDDYVIFGNDKENLGYCINSYFLERSLNTDKTYQDFTQNIFNESNLYLYLNYSASSSYLNSFLSQDFAGKLKEKSFVMSHFQALGLQFVNKEGKLYTNIQIYHSEQGSEENALMWEAALDASVVGKPQWVIDHNTRGKKIIVFDQGPAAYMLSTQGELLWKTDLPEQPISDIFMLDLFKNEKIQYMFNSENYLYVLDLNGKFVDGYPKQLSFKASAGMTLIDYEQKKEYRIMIPANDRSLRNLETDGRAVKGWLMPKTPEIVTKPVSYLKINNKDFLIISDSSGNIVIANRKGETRMKPNPDFTHAKNSSFFTNHKGDRIITSDISGRVVFIDSEGRTEKKTLHDLTEYHHFLYADYDNDSQADYIFIDNQQLWIYNQEWELIKHLELSIGVHPKFKPVYIEKTAAGSALALITIDQSVIVISHQAISPELPELKTQEQFMNTIPINESKSFLLTGKGRIVNCFPL